MLKKKKRGEGEMEEVGMQTDPALHTFIRTLGKKIQHPVVAGTLPGNLFSLPM